MSALTPDLIADVEESFLGFWDDALMDIVRQPYTECALRVYAWRDGGSHIPADGEDGAA
ncbi:hypothetical protein [Streptomyces sp. BA2]|uniref:hypothetical protein n=1 Tax=Streptomyces sp. BA2 TaxID=436595 RepID=UPI001320C295|nr:hypothetical protein [Streptomyces sp. BA2]MWA08840.1 hypothetical protein [Streptomyces sp. BA2]